MTRDDWRALAASIRERRDDMPAAQYNLMTALAMVALDMSERPEPPRTITDVERPSRPVGDGPKYSQDCSCAMCRSYFNSQPQT